MISMQTASEEFRGLSVLDLEWVSMADDIWTRRKMKGRHTCDDICNILHKHLYSFVQHLHSRSLSLQMRFH